LQFAGEVADGLEAVQKATELKPDLILLGIGLPNLDGMQTWLRTALDEEVAQASREAVHASGVGKVQGAARHHHL
jgi:CheY-like chemotaxis protein